MPSQTTACAHGEEKTASRSTAVAQQQQKQQDNVEGGMDKLT